MTTPNYYASGGTYKFRDTITKDGATWDLTSATVTAVFTPPYASGLAQFSRTATKEDAALGIVYYVTLTTDLVAGNWELYFRVVDGSLDLTTEPYGFEVRGR